MRRSGAARVGTRPWGSLAWDKVCRWRLRLVWLWRTHPTVTSIVVALAASLAEGSRLHAG